MPRPFKHSGNGAKLHKMLDEMRKAEFDAGMEQFVKDVEEKNKKKSWLDKLKARIDRELKQTREHKQMRRGATSDIWHGGRP